jgi:hypothetical protein
LRLLLLLIAAAVQLTTRLYDTGDKKGPKDVANLVCAIMNVLNLPTAGI